jgi:hypothetical protein
MSTNDIIMAAAGAGGAPANYIEDVFSTYLYTGNGSTQTITNGIDESGKGALTWIKCRNTAGSNAWFDTARGAGVYLISNGTSANISGSDSLTSFNSNGFTLGADTVQGDVNLSGNSYASWTFRKQPKFFDVVTYTGNGVANRQISHNLGSVPGCVIVKQISGSNPWMVYHRALANQGDFLQLNATNAVDQRFSNFWGTTPFSSTTFSVSDFSEINGNGNTYVAYLFAHNAGGFGLTGTDNVISCGSFTTDGSGNATVNLGYEPQWAMMKRADSTGSWVMVDNMRTWNADGYSQLLANTSGAEAVGPFSGLRVTATGFTCNGGFPASATVIYIAIRRGPMKVPTDATKVFTPQAARGPVSGSGSGSNPSWTTTYPLDLLIQAQRSGGYSPFQYAVDRLRGQQYLVTSNTNAESSSPWLLDTNIGAYVTSASYDTTLTGWLLGRAPGFFDEVCYTGTGSAQSLNHNLGVAPELMIVKSRTSSSQPWQVYCSYFNGGVNANTYALALNTSQSTSDIGQGSGFWNSTSPTSTTFRVGTSGSVNQNGATLVAWLFASCPNVSKVGSYTGTGSTQTISCGFTGGARWVMIKRTDSTGDWYVWDTARGMVSGTDPSILMNSTADEVNANSVYTTTGGFQIVSTAAGINASGGTYIFLAIA